MMAWTDEFSYLLTPLSGFDGSGEDDSVQYADYLRVFRKDFPDIDDADIVLVGVEESRRATEKSLSKAPGAIRNELYELFHHGSDLVIADIGNITAGAHPHDTDHALKTVVKNLLKRNVLVIILGGSQELTFANYSAYEVLESSVNLAVVDALVDLGEFREDLSPENFLSKIVLHDPSYLFNLSILGYQTYCANPASLGLIEKLFFDAHRLGALSGDLKLCEPLMRNADILSIDVNAIADSSAPGTGHPNGFSGSQLCQIARYAGLSDQVSSIGFYNYNPAADRNGQTAKLIAQSIWYVIEGFSHRQREFPAVNKKNFVEYRVHMPDGRDEMIFYKSKRTDKWWMNVPYSGAGKSIHLKHHLVPCSYADYELATSGELPDMWWRTYQKLG